MISLNHNLSSVPEGSKTGRPGGGSANLRRNRPEPSAGGTLTDAQVLKAIREGDESGLRSAVAEYGGIVHGVALGILRQAKLAEEVAHDTFVLLWGRPESFDRRGGSLRAHLIEVARSKAIDLVRREQTFRAEESVSTETPRWLETSLSTDASSHGEDGIKIRTALNGLHRSKKQALFLAYFRGLTYREISEILDIREEEAKTRISDALMTLRSVRR
jgi:RNA polymerase sigma-70 factor, ECF subfamily